MQELCLVLYAIRLIFKLLNKKIYEYNLSLEQCDEGRKKPQNIWTKNACSVD